jgi:putative tricarboxylic transport membrane protein
VITERILEIIFSLFLCVICIWVISEGYALSLGNLDDIGSGFLLFFESILMLILSAANIAGVIKHRGKPKPAFDSHQGLAKVALTIFITLITAVFFEIFGFVLMASLFMVLLLKLVGQEKWLRLSIVTLLTIALSCSIFNLLLNIQLPTGPFGF